MAVGEGANGREVQITVHVREAVVNLPSKFARRC
jgi:hypothetical protein